MSLRDELPPKKLGRANGSETWLEEKDDDFRREFLELLGDESLTGRQIHTVAVKYGYPLSLSAFVSWRSSRK